MRTAEKFVRAVSANTKGKSTPKFHLLLHELLDTIYERKSIDISFATHDQAI